MTRHYADSSFLLALFNARDKYHARAREIAAGIAGRVIISPWVLLEVYDAMSQRRERIKIADSLQRLLQEPSIEVLTLETCDHRAGLELWHARPDKEWSLTDCISFSMMRRVELDAALSYDRHFEQAGFRMNVVE